MRWWQIRKRDADLERELRSDLELEEEEQRENGLPSEEARNAALRAFGNTFLIREQTREAWGWCFWSWQGWRVISRRAAPHPSIQCRRYEVNELTLMRPEADTESYYWRIITKALSEHSG
jgi:hypothetical protein